MRSTVGPMLKALLGRSSKAMEPGFETTTTTTIEEIPDEVLEVVLGFLSETDRNRARLVCKRWLNVSNSPAFPRTQVIVVKDNTDLSRLTVTQTNLHLRLIITRPVPDLEDFLALYGALVRSIEILPQRWYQCSRVVLCNYISYCPKIKSLCFAHSSYRENELLGQYLGSFKRLTSLELRSLGIDEILLFTNYNTKLKSLGVTLLNGQINDKVILLTLIEQQAHTLKQLYLTPSSFMSERMVNEIIDLLGCQLRGLHLPCDPLFRYEDSYWWVSNDFLLEIANKFPDIEELDLSFHVHLGLLRSTIHLHSALSCFTNLKYISLKGTKIRDDVLPALATHQLRGLDLSECSNLTSEGFLKAFQGDEKSTLLKLRLIRCQWVTDALLIRILPQLGNLRALYLDSCSKVTSQGLSAIFSNCKNLTDLSLASCRNIHNLTVPPTINALKHLTFLDLNECYDLTEESIRQLRLPMLQVLCLTSIRVVDIKGKQLVSLLLKHCSSLKTIYLAQIYCDCESINLRILSFETGRKCFIAKEIGLKKEIFDSFDFSRGKKLEDTVYCLKAKFFDSPTEHVLPVKRPFFSFFKFK